jgi:TPR repeat protein
MTSAAETIFQVGKYYYEGKDGVPQDMTRAIELFHQASEMGYAEATFMLGHCYCYGEGVPKDRQEALEYFQEFAATKNVSEQRRAEAYIEIVKCYFELYLNHYRGKGVPKDKTKAAEYLQKIVNMKDDVPSGITAYFTFKLAQCYYSGQGVEKDMSEAIKLFQQVMEMNVTSVKKEATEFLLMVREKEIQQANNKLRDVKDKLATKDDELREMKAAVAMTEMSKKRSADDDASTTTSSSKKSRNVCTIS